MTLIKLMNRVRDFGPCWSRTMCGEMAMMKTSKRWGNTRSGLLSLALSYSAPTDHTPHFAADLRTAGELVAETSPGLPAEKNPALHDAISTTDQALTPVTHISTATERRRSTRPRPSNTVQPKSTPIPRDGA